MREEWTDLPGGAATLREWPQSAQERAFRPVERAILRASLLLPQINPTFVQQLATLTCVSRCYTAYGAYIELVVPDTSPSPSVPLVDEGLGRWTAAADAAATAMDVSAKSFDVGGGALVCWRRSPDRLLGTVLFEDAGRLSLVEFYPIKGEGWSVAECRALLAADPKDVDIRPDVAGA